MRTRYRIAGFLLPLLFASGASAQVVTWTQYQQSYGGSGGYLPKIATDGFVDWISIFQSATGFSDLMYETATDFFGNCPATSCSTSALDWSFFVNPEANPGDVIGHEPSIALTFNSSGCGSGGLCGPMALEVHQGGQDNGADLWSTVGSCNELKINSYLIDYWENCSQLAWLPSQQYGVGFNPSVSIDSQNDTYSPETVPAPPPFNVAEIHQAGSNLSQLLYQIGSMLYLEQPLPVIWFSAGMVTNASGAGVSGYAPSVSLNSGVVVVVYQGTGGKLWYSIGTVNTDEVTWGDPVNYDSGYNPSVSLSNNNSLIEVHQGDNGTGPLYMRLGFVNGSQISWMRAGQPSNESVKYADSGCYPSIAMDARAAQVAEVHSTACAEKASLLYSAGQIIF